MAHTIEFWQEDGKIFVEYNLKKLSFENFLKQNDAKSIINDIYTKIKAHYMDKIEEEIKNPDLKPEVVGIFIKKFFLNKNSNYDVVILGDGSIVNFILEESGNQYEGER